jgi:hypothetical protein
VVPASMAHLLQQVALREASKSTSGLWRAALELAKVWAKQRSVGRLVGSVSPANQAVCASYVLRDSSPNLRPDCRRLGQ